MAEQPAVDLIERQSREWRLGPLLEAAQLSQGDFVDRVKPWLDVRLGRKTHHVRLTAGSNVGTLQIGQLRITVRPRMAAREMTTLIRYALGGDLRATARAELPPGRVGLDELIGIVLADEASFIQQRGLSRRYVQRRERLRALRGRPDFIRSFPWDPEHTFTVACAHYVLTWDNPDNQVLRAALERATLMDVSTTTRRRLLEHRHLWSDIASRCHPTRELFRLIRARYDRLTQHYKLAHNLSEVITTGARPTADVAAGGVTVGGFMLDMALLFELFVSRLIGEWAHGQGLRSELQGPDRGALLDASGAVYRQVRPDIVVYRGHVPLAVLDAKYKPYWLAKGSGESPARKVSNADLYQLFFYAQRLQRRHSLATLPAAFILAPLPEPDERGDRIPVESRYQRIRWRAGQDQAGDVKLVLLPMTGILRELASGGTGDAAARELMDLYLTRRP